MAKGYWVVNVETSDPVAYGAYVAFVGPYVASRGGTFLTRRGQRIVKEGNARQRTVVIEFPSFAEAVAAYEDRAYEEGRKLREAISATDFAIVEGE
jgi:uncharacterized protein (DUF1330 family)